MDKSEQKMAASGFPDKQKVLQLQLELFTLLYTLFIVAVLLSKKKKMSEP